MKTFIDHLIEVSEKNGYDARWMKAGEEADLGIFKCYQEAAQMYARECCKATLKKAAENARCETLYMSRVDKESITDESNIVIV